MGLFDRRHDGPTTRLILEVPLNGNLDKVLRLAVAAVNGVGAGLQAIALALSTPQDNSAEVQKVIDRIRDVREGLQTAIDNQKEN